MAQRPEDWHWILIVVTKSMRQINLAQTLRKQTKFIFVMNAGVLPHQRRSAPASGSWLICGLFDQIQNSVFTWLDRLSDGSSKLTSKDENSLTLTAPALNNSMAPPFQCRLCAHALSTKTTALFTLRQISSQALFAWRFMSIDSIFAQSSVIEFPPPMKTSGCYSSIVLIWCTRVTRSATGVDPIVSAYRDRWSGGWST